MENTTRIKNDYLNYGKELLGKEVKRIDQVLSEIQTVVKIMQKNHEEILSNPEQYNIKNPPRFKYSSNGVYYKTTKNGAALYYSADTKIGKKEKEKALLTEAMDPLLKSIVELDQNIVAAYFNTYDNMSRIYPFIDKLYDLFGPNMHMENHNFYFLADQRYNPERKPVWTEVYLDPAGNGWMFSCIVPIYKNNFLEGVSGIDITIDRLVSNILDIKLPHNAKLFLVDHNGMILGMPKDIEKMMGLAELKNHTYTDPITKTVTKPLEYNIFKNQTTFAKHFKDMIEKNKTNSELSLNGKKYITLQQIVTRTKWKLMIVIDEKKIFSSINELKTFSDRIGYFAIMFMVGFYLIYFYILAKKSLELSKTITKPLRTLNEHTSQISLSNNDIEIVDTDIKEIYELSSNFSKMAKELDDRTVKLHKEKQQKQEKIKEVELYKDKSVRDHLTGLFNRAKIEQQLELLYMNFKENKELFSLIYLDIDHFKDINDTLGHAKGDVVLKEISNTLQKTTRGEDIVGRIGGEEFLILVRNNSDTAQKIAEKLRVSVETTNIIEDRAITCSFGVTQITDEDSVDTLLKRADDALYKAKRNGRNRVVLV